MQNERFLGTAYAFLNKRANVVPAITELRAKPDIFTNLRTEFDGAITSLNEFIANPNDPSQLDKTLLPNAVNIKSVLGTSPLPTLKNIDTDPSYTRGTACGKAFRKANVYMQNGEENKEGVTRWDFHKNLTAAPDLAAASMIEIYGVYASIAFPELEDQSHNLVLALEEMLALHHRDTNLFKKVREWYIEDEGFSRELVALVQSN